MSNQENFQPELRRRANDFLRQLSSSEREALLIRCWMSHDARWFMAVALNYGIEVANRLNKIAAHETGKAEAKRIIKALQLSVKNMDDYLLAQEIFIAFLGPDLLDYRVVKIDESTCQVQVNRCFAYENVVRAGIADYYECGIFARVTGWIEALGLDYEITPSPGKCMKVEGRECVYTFRFEPESK
jgi:predicted DNA-binding protein